MHLAAGIICYVALLFGYILVSYPHFLQCGSGSVAGIFFVLDSAGDPADDLKAMASLPPALLATCVTAARLPSGSQPLPQSKPARWGWVFRAARRNLFLQAGGDPIQWMDPNPWETTPLTSPSYITYSFRFSFSGEEDEIRERVGPSGRKRVQRDRRQSTCKADGELCQPDRWTTSSRRRTHKRTTFSIASEGLCAESTTLRRFRSIHTTQQEVPEGHEVQDLSAYLWRADIWRRKSPGPANLLTMAGELQSVENGNVDVGNFRFSPPSKRYELLVENMVKQLPGCWHLIVSAEDRARSDSACTLPNASYLGTWVSENQFQEVG